MSASLRPAVSFPAPNSTYTGWPSCMVCLADFLGQGECGACLLVRRLLGNEDRLLRALETLARWQPPLSITGRPNMPALHMRDVAREALGLDPETGEPRTALDKGHLDAESASPGEAS